MFGSLRLGKFFGIDTYVHGTFWLLPLFVFVSAAAAGNPAGAVGEVLFLFALFGCVALHEVGHALAARYYGVRTRDITLYPMGGVASLERMPEKPGQEVVIALAGPAVNVVIAAGIFVGLLGGVVAFPSFFDLSAADPFDGFIVRLMVVNVWLVLFNLIPSFPMDGGRVLRAILATVMNRLDATKAAVGFGSVLAIVGGVYGLLDGSYMLAFVAVVVFLLGHAELAAVRAAENRRSWRDRDDENDWVKVLDVRPHGSFSGWVWDARRRAWVEWRNGVAIREVVDRRSGGGRICWWTTGSASGRNSRMRPSKRMTCFRDPHRGAPETIIPS